jgi:LPXTG-site transpeptidase (sortase) family protein
MARFSRWAHNSLLPKLHGTETRRLRRLVSTFLLSFGVSLVLLTGAAYEWTNLAQKRLLKDAMNVDVPVSSAEPGIVLSIPKVRLKAAILEGTDSKSLLLAPGHLASSVLPGESGNAVIAGHRDTFFRHIHELESGDDILITRGGHQFHYIVTEKFIVDPQNLSVTRPTPDGRLTLVTCYPTYYIGPAPKRLIVVASLLPGYDVAGIPTAPKSMEHQAR